MVVGNAIFLIFRFVQMKESVEIVSDKSLSVMLKRWRLSQKMGYSQASKEIGITQSSLYNYESREVSPSYNTAEKLGKVLGVSAVEIIEMSKFDRSMKSEE